MKTFEDFANNLKKISLAQVAKLVLGFNFLLIVTCEQKIVQINPINSQNELGNVTKHTKG